VLISLVFVIILSEVVGGFMKDQIGLIAECGVQSCGAAEVRHGAEAARTLKRPLGSRRPVGRVNLDRES
jgi:hypothetical protein